MTASAATEGAQPPVLGPGVIFVAGPAGAGKGTLATEIMKRYGLPPERCISSGDVLRQALARVESDPTYAATFQKLHNINSDVRILSHPLVDPLVPELMEQKAEVLRDFLAERRGVPPETVDTQTTTQFEWFVFCMERRVYLPSVWLNSIFSAHLRSIPDLDSVPVILDGTPRRPDEAPFILNLMRDAGMPFLHLFHMHVEDVEELVARTARRNRSDDSADAVRHSYAFYEGTIRKTIETLQELFPENTTNLDATLPPEVVTAAAFHALDHSEPKPVPADAARRAAARLDLALV